MIFISLVRDKKGKWLFALASLVRKKGNVVHFSGFRPKNEPPLLFFASEASKNGTKTGLT
jgi:hypothetical protein